MPIFLSVIGCILALVGVACLAVSSRRRRAADPVRREDVDKDRRFLLQLINTLPMSVCYIDTNEIIRLCDLDFCREAGAGSPEELIGRPYAEVGPYGVFYQSEDARMLRGEGGDYSDIDSEMTKNGATRSFTVRRIVMRDAAGKIQGLVKAFRDTTDFVAANHAAKAAERAKAAFLANMSHELRTPMNGIVGMADLIIDNKDATPVQSLYAETIIKSAKTLQMVIDEVMDIATIDDASRRLTLATAPFPLLTLTEEAAQIVSCIIEAWGVNLYLSYDFGLNSMHHGDARRIKQILVQFLTYCARLASDRKIRLDVVRAEDGRVAFRAVFMPPPDIPPEDLADLFRQPAAPAASRAQDGNTGFFDNRVGLPLLWRLIVTMRGTLEVRSIVGGVECEILLPPGSPGLHREGPGCAAMPLMPPDLTGMRILVTTSDARQYEAARACLEFAGARVGRAADRGDARRMVAAARRIGAEYHMLALDCAMAEEAEIRDFLADLHTSADCGDPPVMLIVASRQVQGLPGMAGNIGTLLLPPVLPSEMWYKAKMIFSGEESGTPVAVSRGTTTVMMRRRSTRVARLVRIPAKVLLVEDNSVNQMVAMGILRRIGCEATLAEDGREAVELVRGGGAYDLILMDCLMPVMDGYEATNRIRMLERADAKARRNTIVALTANSVAGDKEKCLAAGMDGYIAKPVTLDSLREVVAKYCPGLVTVVDETEDE